MTEEWVLPRLLSKNLNFLPGPEYHILSRLSPACSGGEKSGCLWVIGEKPGFLDNGKNFVAGYRRI